MADELKLVPVVQDQGLKDRVFNALRHAVVSMDIYATETPPRLDERQLAQELGVSRTPVREALSRLEQEGLVRNIPRRGTFVVRKTKREVIDIIEVWAALESMAARLATQHASDAELEQFRRRSESYLDQDREGAHIDEYSDNNIKFHQDIIALSKNDALITMASRLFDQMHAIRASTIKDPKRTVQSVIDHMRIIDALVHRETDDAERFVRDHALNLARHVDEHVKFLDDD